MRPEIVNRSGTRVPRRFLEAWVAGLTRNLGRAAGRVRGKELGLIFLKPGEARRLNKTCRGRDYATDVLSFEGDGRHMLGELVFCPEVLQRQAKEHGLAYREELGYMVIHGVLHLLGYDHESGSAEARRMYALQDRIFERLCEPPETAKSGFSRIAKRSRR